MKWIKPRVSFLNEDMNLAKSIMKKKFDDYEKLKTLLAKNLGYMGKFTEYLINENIPFVELERLYKDLTELKDKQAPVNINALSYEKVLDQVQSSKEDILINKLVSQFPSEQKKIAREMLSADNESKRENNKNILLKVAQKPDLIAFISKISRYKTDEQLKDALKVFSKDANNDRDKVIELLKSLKSQVVYTNDDILIVKVAGFEDIKKLGSDTSWCIVGSQGMYDRYAKGRNQFIVYNYKLEQFDPKFKIGFTLTNDGVVYAAHDILDTSASLELKNVMLENGVEFSSLIPKVDPITIDLKKLNSKTTGDAFKQIADQIQLELVPQLVKIVIATNKKDDTKQVILRKCFKRILGNREWILEDELDKIDRNFHNFVRYEKTIITDLVDTTLNEPAFLKGLDIWTVDEFAELGNMSNIKGIEQRHSKETLLKFSDKLNDLYLNKLKLSDFEKMDKEDKGVRFNKRFEGIMLLMNALCDRVEKTPDYDKIIKIPNNTLQRYKGILKLPIDLNEYGVKFSIEDIPLIIKQDMSTEESYVYIEAELDKYTKLLEHLTNNKIVLKITKHWLKTFIKSPDKYNTNGANDRIYKLLSQFNVNRLISGKTVTDGNLTIKVV